MTTISKKDLALLHATAKEQVNIYALAHVKLTPTHLYASNAHSLYSCLINNQHANFPDCNITGAVEHIDGCILLSAELLKSVNIPTDKRNPVFNNIEVLIDDTHKHIITTDLKAVRDVKVPHEDLEWPNQAQIELAASNLVDTKQVRLSVEELEVLVKILKQRGDESAVLTVAGRENMVQVDTNSGLKGYIVPMTE